MCKISVNYDTKKREEAQRTLSRFGISVNDGIRMYLDFLANDPKSCDKLMEKLIKEKVKNDPDNTVYRFKNAEDAMNFLEHATN